MLNCAIYPRKSKQVDNSDSMDAQIDMCKRYLDTKYGNGKYNITIYDGDYGMSSNSIITIINSNIIFSVTIFGI